MYYSMYEKCKFDVHEIDMDTDLKIAATHGWGSQVGRPYFNTVLSVVAVFDCTNINMGRKDMA